MFGQNQVGLPRSRADAVVGIGPVDQDHDVPVLFQLTRFAQVRRWRDLVGALLVPAIELADSGGRSLQMNRFNLAELDFATKINKLSRHAEVLSK